MRLPHEPGPNTSGSRVRGRLIVSPYHFSEKLCN